MGGLAFDESLVLYGWQEDRDFGAKLAKRGQLVQRLDTVPVPDHARQSLP
jgi:hypothetical protein